MTTENPTNETRGDNTDPLARFARDRQHAWDAQDPMAALCTVGNVAPDGVVHMRTLVLRNVGDALAIFINATSPKWPHLQDRFALHTYWPSVQVQYRLQVNCTVLEPDVVRESWLLRPLPPKTMDWFYHATSPQSSAIADREHLLAQLGQLQLPEPLTAPPEASGLLLDPQEVERLDLTQADGVHDRQRYTRTATGWHSITLVP